MALNFLIKLFCLSWTGTAYDGTEKPCFHPVMVINLPKI